MLSAEHYYAKSTGRVNGFAERTLLWGETAPRSAGWPPPALERLGRSRDDAALPETMAAFGIRGHRAFASLFSTHPSIEARIDALRAAAAGSTTPHG